jgi:hypothetical protein
MPIFHIRTSARAKYTTRRAKYPIPIYTPYWSDAYFGYRDIQKFVQFSEHENYTP